ncbi:conserved membrane hypothetical protein [Pseudomonas sp. OF001]|jgi:uncharacterized membrane protein|uniref:hypothetical protein n=1 Tax=unclassified Pseudomonas TaxID=196821 RepID=UPI00191889D7|nr:MULTISPECIES: hypothetical protein [unclassified Pseudomonas]WPP46213.1 hypothetical protein SK095_02130 [Pseudomonas sp. AN-1]CAD5377941.1 conserved membrane hypothetical protein [Pseudomonas sp. OF001]
MELSNFLQAFLQQETAVELARMGIVYVHLIACCVAVGLILTSDVALIRNLLRGGAAEPEQAQHLEHLKKSVSLALIVLWVSGIGIVGLDYAGKGMEYFLNPKLQAKVTIVTLLTLNGFILHGTVLPALQKSGSLLQLPRGLRSLALLAGSVSAVSWFYAAMLGIGRPLAWKYSLLELMAAYPLLIAAGFLGMQLLCSWAERRNAGEDEWPAGVIVTAH